MTDIATLAEHAIRNRQGVIDDEAKQAKVEAILKSVSPVVRKLFVVLHAAYGSLFTSKFATGQKVGEHDMGMVSAMKVWDSTLSRLPGEVIEAAAARLNTEHPEFPPNLPQFERLCAAAMPRKTWAQEQGLPALPAPKIQPVQVSLDARGDGKDWARRILARIEQGDRTVTPYIVKSARQALRVEARA